MHRSVLPIIIAAPLLGGCISAEGFPDLGTRAVEGTLIVEPAIDPEPAPPIPVDEAFAERVARLTAQADDADRAFDAAAGAVEARAERAADSSPSSETWVAAQTEISALQRLVQPIDDALAELDALYIASTDAGEPTGDLAAVLEKMAVVSRENWDRIARMAAQLESPPG